MTNVNFWRLECFVALAQELHFGRAARKLFVSQPALSQQVKQLEEELDVKLVNRTGGISLTSAGELLFAEGLRLLREIGDVVDKVRAAGPVVNGDLRILYTRSVAVDVGFAALRDFRERYPEVEVSSQTMWTSWNVIALRDHLADVAFVRLPLLDAPEIDTLPLGGDPQMLVMARDHDLATRSYIDRTSMPEVTMVPWIRDDAPGNFGTMFDPWDRARVTFAAPEPDVMRRIAAARSMGGVTLIHEFDRDNLSAGLVAKPIEPPLSSAYGIAWRHGSSSAAVIGFVECCRELFTAGARED